MDKATGFWSYTHADDEAEDGRIKDLAHDLVKQYEMLTGSEIELFLDKDSLKTGQKWKEEINSSLASAAFIIPVLTPRYFQSAACRAELNTFISYASELGVSRTIVPILYVDVKELADTTSTDPAIKAVQELQYHPMTEVRLMDRNSSEYRKTVWTLANRIKEINESLDKESPRAKTTTMALVDKTDTDDAPGDLDILGESEETIPEMTQTISVLSEEVSSVGDFMTKATAKINESDRKGQGFIGRLRVVKELERQLNEPASKIESLGEKFITQLHKVDPGIRFLISNLQTVEKPSGKDKVAREEFFASVGLMAREVGNALDHAEGMLKAFEPIEKMSRDLRRPLKQIRHGITLMLEARQITSEWLAMMADKS